VCSSDLVVPKRMLHAASYCANCDEAIPGVILQAYLFIALLLFFERVVQYMRA
jgi:hypothetical protein